MNETYKLMMDVGSFIANAEKVTNKLSAVDDLFKQVEATTQSYNKKGQLVGQTFKGLAKNGEDLSVSLKAVRDGFRLTNAAMSNGVETAKKYATNADKLTQSIENGVNKALYKTATLQEKLTYKNAIASLNEYVRANEIAADKIALVQGNLAKGSPGAYTTPGLQGLQAKLVAAGKAQGNLGGANAAAQIQAAATAQANLNQQVAQGTAVNTGYLVSWQSISRFFEARILYNVVQDIQSAFKEGQVEAMEFEKVIGRVLTLAQDSGSGFKGWADSVKELSNQFGTSAKDTAEAYYSALSNQIGHTVPEIENYVKVTQQFALVTGSTAEQANNLFSSAINSFKMSAGDASTIASKFFKIIDLGRIKAADLANTFGRTAVPAQVLGVSFDELAAGLTVLTRNGNTASDAQTQLLNLFNKFIKPTEELQKLLDKHGYSTGQAAIQAVGFTGAMHLLDEELRTGGLQQLGKEINDIRGFRGAIGLLGESTKDYLSDLAKIPAGQAQYDTAIQTSMKVTGQKLSIELNRAKNVFLEIGQSANETVVKLLSLFGNDNNGLAGIIHGVVEATTVLAGTAGVGAVAYAITKLIPIVLNLRTSIVALNAVILANPYALLVAGAALITAAFIDAAYNAKTTAQVYQDAFQTMQNAQSENLQKFNSSVTAYAEKLQKANNSVYGNLEQNAATLTATSSATLREMGSLYSDYADKLTIANETLESSITEGITKSKNAITEYTTEIEKAQKSILKLQREQNKVQFDDSLDGKTSGQKIKALVSESSKLASSSQDQAGLGNADLAREQMKESVDYMKEAIKLQKEIDRRVKQLKSDNIEGKLNALDRRDAVAKFREQVSQGSKKGTSRTSGLVAYADEQADSSDKYDALISKQVELSQLQSDNPHLDILKQQNAEYSKQISLEQQIIDITEENKNKEIAALATKQKAFQDVKELDKQLADINRVQKDNPIFDKSNKIFGDRGVNAPDVLNEFDKIGAARDAAAQAAGVSNEYLLNLNRDLVNRRTSLAIEVTAFAQHAASTELARQIEESKQTVDRAISEAKTAQQANGSKIVGDRSTIAGFAANLPNGTSGTGTAGVDINELKNQLSNVPNDLTALGALRTQISAAIAQIFSNASDTGTNANAGTSLGDTIDALTGAQKAVATMIGDLSNGNSIAASFQTAGSVGTTAISDLTSQLAALQQQIAATSAQASQLFNASQAQSVTPNVLTKAAGGMIHGSDTVPALLGRGEFVMNARSSRQFASQLTSMNTGLVKFNAGGSTSNTTNVGGITINAGNSTDVRSLGQALRREIKRGTVKL